MAMTPDRIASLLARYPARQAVDNKGTPIARWFAPPARLAFPALIEPKAMEGSARAMYSAALLFPASADLSLLRTTAADVARSFHGPNTPLRTLRNPFRNQSEKTYDGFSTDPEARYINCSSQYKPVLVTSTGDQINADDERVYPGMWVVAKLSCYGYNTNGNKGVSFGLVSLQKVADDEPFATGGDAASGFIVDTRPAAPSEPIRSAAAPRGYAQQHANTHNQAPLDMPRRVGPSAMADDEIPF